MGHAGEAGPSLNGLEAYLGRSVDPNSICATILECLALKKYWPKWAGPPGRAHYPTSTCYYFSPLPMFQFLSKIRFDGKIEGIDIRIIMGGEDENDNVLTLNP